MSGMQAELRRIAGLATISQTVIEELSAAGTVIACNADAAIFEQAQVPDALDILLRGVVQLSTQSRAGDSAVVDIVEPVECLAFAAVWLRAPYLVSARALKASTLFRIPADTASELLRRDPATLDAVARSLCSQYRSAVGQIADLKLRSVAQRLGGYLVTLFARHPGREIALPCEKRVLAARLGTTAEHLSRAFGMLRLYGVISHGARVQIIDLDRLKAFAVVSDATPGPDTHPRAARVPERETGGTASRSAAR